MAIPAEPLLTIGHGLKRACGVVRITRALYGSSEALDLDVYQAIAIAKSSEMSKVKMHQ